MREIRRRFVIGLAAGIFLAAGVESLSVQRNKNLPIHRQPDHPPVIGTGKDAASLEPRLRGQPCCSRTKGNSVRAWNNYLCL
jgi:hypothetical protein